MERYRNDISCKRKWKHTMETAAERWGTHPGTELYVCNHCGYIHFASDGFSRIERAHQSALELHERRLAFALHPKSVPPIRVESKRKRDFLYRSPPRFSAATTCKVTVWKAEGASIGTLLRLKGIEPPGVICD